MFCCGDLCCAGVAAGAGDGRAAAAAGRHALPARQAGAVQQTLALHWLPSPGHHRWIFLHPKQVLTQRTIALHKNELDDIK